VPPLGSPTVEVTPARLKTVAPRRSIPDRRWLFAAVLLAVPLVVLALGAWTDRWMSDDGFINLRVVSQIKAGHGPVFNAGERVEAFTSPLWLATLLVADILTPLRLEWVAVITGFVLTLGGLVMALVGSVRLQRGIADRPVWLPLGALVFVAFAPTWRFTTGGLENGLTFAWLGACLLVLATWAAGDSKLPLAGAVVLGVGPLVRPELTVMSVAFVALVIGLQWQREQWRNRFALLAAAFALPLLYEIFRMGYYGSLVPNPAIAKEASRSYWFFGRIYLHQALIESYALWVPLLILLLGAYVPLLMCLRRDARFRPMLVALTFLLGGLFIALYVARVGGDFMPVRLLLPSLFSVVAPVAVVPATRRFLGATLVVPWALVAIIGLRSGIDIPGFHIPRNAITATQLLGPGFDAQFAAPGVYVDFRHLPGTPLFDARLPAFYGVGATSYRLGPDVYVLDLLGLGDPFTAHLRLDRRTIPGHEKPLPAPWIAARLFRPGRELRGSDFPRPFVTIIGIDDPGRQPFADRAADARRALECPRIRDFIASYRAPLDAGRFVDNLGAAFTNFGFRIPPEPRDAVREFCSR
jgi:arabinofuranosyltransferase